MQRQLTTNLAVEASYVGKIGSKLVGHNYFNAAPFINSPITGLPPTLQNVEERVPVSPGDHQRAVARARQLLPQHYHSLQLRVERRFARSVLVLRLVRAVEEHDQSAGEHHRPDQQHPEPVRSRLAVGAVVPRSPARRRGVVGVEPAALSSRTRSLGALLNGWTMTGFHRIQSGGPLVFTMGTDVAQNGILQPNGQYALLVPGATADDVRPRPFARTADMIAMYFNTAAFVPRRQRAARHLRQRRARR